MKTKDFFDFTGAFSSLQQLDLFYLLSKRGVSRSKKAFPGGKEGAGSKNFPAAPPPDPRAVKGFPYTSSVHISMAGQLRHCGETV